MVFESSPVRALWAFDSADVWAGGRSLAHWDGTSWSEYAIPSSGRTWIVSEVRDFWGFAPDDLYALGSGELLHWDGVSWTLKTAEIVTQHISLSGSSGSDLWMSGSILGGVDHWDGSRMTRQFDRTSVVSDLWASGPENVYAVDYRGVHHWDGSSWEAAAVFGRTSNTSKRYGVWGASDRDVWVAGGLGFSHWDGADWTHAPSTSDETGNWVDIWGSAADDVWAVEEQGQLWHYDGGRWREMTPYVESYSARALHISAEGDVWVGGTIVDYTVEPAEGAGLVHVHER